MSADTEKIKKALKDRPKDAGLLRRLGFQLLLEANYKSAKDHYRLAVFYDPHLLSKIILDYERLLSRSLAELELRVSLAEFYLSIGDLNNAVLEFEETLEMDPECVALYNALGKIYLGQGQLDRAIELLEKALHSQVSDVALTEMLAGAYLEKKRYPEAIALYQEVLSVDPANKKVMRILGELNLRIGKFDAAADYFFSMFSEDPEVSREVILHLEELSALASASQHIKERLADLYFRSMQPDKAIAVFDKIFELNPSRLDDAIQNCRKVLKSYPAHPAALLSLANWLAQKGEYSEAAAEYQKLARLLPEYLDRAVAGYKKIIAACPTQILAHQYLAEAYIKQNQLPEAILEFEVALRTSSEMADEIIARCQEILKSQPDFLLARQVLGRAYLVTGDLRRAVSKAEEIIALDKKNAAAYGILGEAYAGLKLSRKASDALHTALTLDPLNRFIHEQYQKIKEKEIRLEIESNQAKLAEDPWKIALHLDLGKLYFTLGEIDKAVEEFQIAAKDRTRAPFAYNLLGCSFRLNGRFDLAQKSFEKAREVLLPELYELKKTLWFNLGTTYVARGALMKAVQSFEEVLQEDQNFMGLKATVKRLKASKIAALRSKKIVCVLKEIGSGQLIGLWGTDGKPEEKSSRQEAFSMSFGQSHNTGGFDSFMQGMFSSAKEEFQLSADLDSRFAPGLNNLAVCLMLEGNLDAALINLEGALDCDIESSVFYNNLGILYYLRGNLKEAIKILEKAKNFDENSAAIKINLGTLYYLEGAVELALRLFADIPEDDVLADLAKRRLLYKVP
ncbi:MAG: tetratricopeptide repeat protein [Candidatus Margulisiibacteriota bacterium]